MTELQQKQVEKIRNNYTRDTKQKTKFEELKELDSKVKKPARIFAYVFGIIGTLILGTGMCLAMKVIGDLMALGIVVGVLGIIMISINYPIYKAILKRRKAKYSAEIVERSDELLNK